MKNTIAFKNDHFSTADTVPSEVTKLEKSLIFHLKTERALLLFSILVTAILGVLVQSSAVRFAITHSKIAGNYATEYFKVEKASKEAANEVIKSWVETGRVK